MSKGRGSYSKRQAIKRRLAATERVCWLGLEPLNFKQTDHNAPDFVDIDEELPVGKGGSSTDINNCHLVCHRHNMKKGARILPRGYYARQKSREVKTSREW